MSVDLLEHILIIRNTNVYGRSVKQLRKIRVLKQFNGQRISNKPKLWAKFFNNVLLFLRQHGFRDNQISLNFYTVWCYIDITRMKDYKRPTLLNEFLFLKKSQGNIEIQEQVLFTINISKHFFTINIHPTRITTQCRLLMNNFLAIR